MRVAQITGDMRSRLFQEKLLELKKQVARVVSTRKSAKAVNIGSLLMHGGRRHHPPLLRGEGVAPARGLETRELMA